MPERKKTVKLASVRAQGKDSWVELIPLTVKGSREYRRTYEAAETVDEREALVLAELRAHIVAWNWVDEDGKPLPSPQDNPEVLEGLTSREVAYLRDALNGGDELELKN